MGACGVDLFILRCGHTICTECFERQWRCKNGKHGKNVVRCPVRRQDPNTGIYIYCGRKHGQTFYKNSFTAIIQKRKNASKKPSEADDRKLAYRLAKEESARCKRCKN